MKHYAVSLAALALAAALAGCASFPLLSQSSRLVESRSPAAAAMDDGVLRFLYAANTNGGGTLLLGNTSIYHASASQRITLVNDPVTGLPAAWELETNENSTTRITEVHSPDGSLLWSGEGEWRAAMAGSLLALEPGGWQAEAGPSGETGCHLIDLSTGEEIPLPPDASSCIPTAEGQVVLTITTQENSPNLENSSVVVQTLDGQQLLHLDRAYAYPAYGFEGENSCISIQQYQPDTGLWVNSLYNPAAQEWIPDFFGFCGPDLICYQQEDGRYVVRTLDDPTPLATYEGGCSYWNNGLALVSTPDSDGVLYFADGTSRPLYSFLSYVSDPVSSSFLFADGTLLLCSEDGTMTYLEPDLHGAAQVSLYSADGGYVILALSDEDYNTIAYQIYDASGLVYDSAAPGALHFYTRISYLTSVDGCPLYQAAYDGPAGSTLYDVLDCSGNVLLTGLADVAASSLFNLPDGIFGARQGFERGFMTSTGEWVYAESMFTSLSADDGFDYL